MHYIYNIKSRHALLPLFQQQQKKGKQRTCMYDAKLEIHINMLLSGEEEKKVN